MRGGRTNRTGPTFDGGLAVEYLQDRWERSSRIVAGEPETVADTRGMAQKCSRGYRQTTTEWRIRQSPGFQNGVDILVEAEPAVLDGLERRHGGDRLADRCSLIERFLRGRRSGLGVGHSQEFAQSIAKSWMTAMLRPGTR